MISEMRFCVVFVRWVSAIRAMVACPFLPHPDAVLQQSRAQAAINSAFFILFAVILAHYATFVELHLGIHLAHVIRGIGD